MYSFAPAWNRRHRRNAASATAPQATTGVRMRSASSAATRSTTESATSIMIRSAPLARSHREALVDVVGLDHRRAAVHRDARGGGELAVQPADDDEAHALSSMLVS